MNEAWALDKLIVTAKIDGEAFPITGFVCTTELNTIPIATIRLAVGRDISGGAVAKIHTAVNKLRIRLKAEVFLQVIEGDAQGIKLNWGDATKRPVRIFDGYAVGTGWERSTAAAGFTVHLEHWLADLNYASSVSGSSHPGNPVDFTYHSSYVPPGVADFGSTEPHWVPLTTVQQNNVTNDTLQQGVWSEIMHKMLLELSQSDPIDPQLGIDSKPNQVAVNALNRMRGDSGGKYAANTGMELLNDDPAISEGIRNALALSNVSSWANTTLWSKLVAEWCPQFFLAISPRIEDAIIFPLAGGLRSAPFAKILRGDYDQAAINGQMPQVLRAVGIIHPAWTSWGGVANSEGVAAPSIGLAGQYPPPPGKDGMLMLKRAPDWLTDPAIAYTFAGETTGIISGQPVITALTAQQPENKTDVPAVKAAKATFNNFLTRYAQQLYVLESLKGRVGEISGRLRFDVAPGSQVTVEGSGDRFITGDQLDETLYGMVIRVSHAIDSESSQARTSFTIAHHRTAQENRDDDTSVERPPLYKTGWKGAPLIDGFDPI